MVKNIKIAYRGGSILTAPSLKPHSDSYHQYVSVCSTTLWVGHLSKLIAEDDLSDMFGEFGEILSINTIPPRGCAFICMNRRMDAYKALKQLHKTKLHGKQMTVNTIAQLSFMGIFPKLYSHIYLTACLDYIYFNSNSCSLHGRPEKE